jgi:phage tail-like protein
VATLRAGGLIVASQPPATAAPQPAAYYPPPGFAFAVGVVPGSSGAQQTAIDAAFQEVSGLDPKVAVEEVTEGGLNAYIHQLPGVTKHSNLVLKRGYVTQASALATWAGQTVGSTLGTPIATQVITISLLGPDSAPAMTWRLENAWPVKWEVSGFNATRNDVLTETLEIAYSTITRSAGAAAG